MKTLFFILWFTIAITCNAQTVFRMQMNLERVAITHIAPTTHEVREILIVTQGDEYFGIFTGYDTLDLKRVKHFQLYDVYIDIRHDNQLYYIVRKHNSEGQFGIFIAPLKPYKRKLWGINLSNI